jgi:hypothetical protein
VASEPAEIGILMSALITDELASEALAPQSPPESITIPERAIGEWGIALAIGFLSCLYLIPFYRFTSLIPDEGISLQGAQRILGGEVLYRDFFALVTPGSYYWTALLFKIFGNSILTARATLVVYGGVFSLLTYLLARRVCSRRNAALGASLLTITSLPYYFVSEHNWDSTLWALLALYCAVRWLETAEGGKQKAEGRNQKAAGFHSSLITHHSSLVSGLSPLVSRLSSPSLWALATGSLASLTCLFEQSKGGGLVLGLALGFLLIHCTYGEHRFFTRKPLATLARKDSHHRRHREHGEQNSVVSVPSGVKGVPRGEWIYAVLGFFWPFVVTLVYFATKHSLTAMLADWFWPLKHYNSVNRVPYGFLPISPSEWHTLHSGSIIWRLFAVFVLSPSFLVPALPILALVILGCRLFKVRERRVWDQENAYYVLICSCIGGLLLSLLVARPGLSHIMFLGPILYLVLCWIFEGKAFGGAFLPAARRPITAYALLSFSGFALALLVNATNAHHLLETRRGALRATDQDTVISYVQKYVPEGSKIFVYPYQPLYYYLTGTSNSTPYEFVYRGYHTPAQIQQVIDELDSSHTAAVLFAPSFSEIALIPFPSTPLKVLAETDPVVKEILSRYRPCETLHSAERLSYVFLVRKGSACPESQLRKSRVTRRALTQADTENVEGNSQ